MNIYYLGNILFLLVSLHRVVMEKPNFSTTLMNDEIIC